MPAINPVTAASHANPYPYYTSLLAGAELPFDPQLKLWVASRASIVQQILAHPHCAVRPSAEPVPSMLAGSSAGEVFAQLMRMNEAAAHALPKQAVQASLRMLDLSKIADRTSVFARRLAGAAAQFDAAALNSWMFALPVYVVGDLLGFPETELPLLAHWMSDFVRCLSPLSTAAQLHDANLAASALGRRFRTLLQTSAGECESLIGQIRREADSIGWHQFDALLANLIGLLSQTYEATAGLIGNAIVLLTQRHELTRQLRQTPALLPDFVREVCRFDSPVQNTRRFVTQDMQLAGVSLQAGDVILLVLAAANRDEAVYPRAGQFLLQREPRQLFSFGLGHHACPGQELALRIAGAALQTWLERPPPAPQLEWTYRASPNGRIPLFTNPRN